MIAQAMRAILLASATATLGRLLGEQLHDPGMLVGMPPRMLDHSRGPDDQQSPQIAVALLRYAAEPLLAAGRVLPRHETDPGGKIRARI